MHTWKTAAVGRHDTTTGAPGRRVDDLTLEAGPRTYHTDRWARPGRSSCSRTRAIRLPTRAPSPTGPPATSSSPKTAISSAPGPSPVAGTSAGSHLPSRLHSDLDLDGILLGRDRDERITLRRESPDHEAIVRHLGAP